MKNIDIGITFRPVSQEESDIILRENELVIEWEPSYNWFGVYAHLAGTKRYLFENFDTLEGAIEGKKIYEALQTILRSELN